MRRWVAILGILLLCALASGCKAVPRGTEPPDSFVLGEDIYIEGVNASRTQVQYARAVLQAYLDERIESMWFDIHLEGASNSQTIRVQANELPILTNMETAIHEAAYLPQHNGLRRQKRELDVALQLDTEAARARAEEICAAYYVAPVNATATLDKSQEGNFAYTADRTGIEVKPDDIITLLAQAVEKGESAKIALPYTTLYPAYTEQQAREEHQLISQFSTSYAKSPLNASGRVFNIKKAASIIDGTVLSPGEEFSTNDILGPRNAENGWKKAPGIREGRYEQEYGGGVCQVSTTLFNAVMMADLEITQRQPHSWPSGYVDIGRDATISTGGPNFCFVNSRGYDLYVLAETDSKKTLTISIYGKPIEDGITVKISSKRTETLSSLGEEVLLDESLPANTRVVYREARRGKKSETYKEYYDAEGNLIDRVLVYADTYRSIKGTVYVSADIYYGWDDTEDAEEDTQDTGIL